MIEGITIVKQFGQPPQEILHSLNFTIKDGEYVSISGKSGSGKSTLMYIISTLDNPTSGTILIDGINSAKMSVDEVHAFRNKYVGFVFQFHYLLPELTALENVLLPARNLNVNKTKEAIAFLDELGVAEHKDKFPSQMSGGEQQRVAIARALILQPKYIFADEPTGNLDTANADIVMSMLKRENQQHGTTISLVTHDPDFAKQADREIFLIDGRIRS